jgi:hypothetical protein
MPPPLRKSLRWTLAASFVLAGAALFWPARKPPSVVQPADVVTGQALPTDLAAGQRLALPGQLARPNFEPGDSFDPFAGVVAVAKPVPPPAPAPVPPQLPVPVAAPVPPPLNYRYLGRMADPSGALRVYLAQGDQVLPVLVGTRLAEGYVVQAIDDAGVRLHYPPLGTEAMIAIAPAPEPTSR